MLAERLRKRIQPVRARDEILESFCRLHVLDPERDGVNAFVHRAFDLSFYLRLPVRARRKNQHHDPAGFDRIDDRFAPVSPRHDVTRRDPAANALLLELGNESVGDRLIFCRMTYKNIVRHCDQVSW